MLGAQLSASGAAASSTTKKSDLQTRLEPPESHVKRVLEEAKKDLDNADLPLKFISNPVRDNVLQPVLGIASGVLPAVTSIIPFADDIAALSLSVPFNVMRFGYGVVHPDVTTSIRQDASDAMRRFTDVEVLKRKIENDPDVEKLRKSIEKDLRGAKADFLGLKGYIISNTVEILSDPDSKLSEWTEASGQLAAYVENIGLGKELRNELLINPRSDVNLRILGHAQAAWDNELSRRQRTFLDKHPKIDSLHEIAKLMRYSTAAFGQQMMEAEHAIDDDRQRAPVKKSGGLVGSEELKGKVCEHIGIPTSYITYFAMGPGGSMQLLRHFISIDDDLEAVVLAIRGTGSFSGWVIDFQGMGRAFCDGVAHKGMADMADAILANSKGEILRALKSKPSYRLLITGESLGGGVSPLVNLLCHLDKDISKFSIKAHPFAGPPVYFQTAPNAKVEKAIENCTAYIHRDDIVAHCSVSAVQRLVAKLQALDKITRKMSVFDRRLIAAGRKPPTEALANAALTGDSNLPLLEGAPELYMPASSIVWFCPETDSDKEHDYNVMVCDAKKVAALGLPVTINMISDHPPYVYESILNKVELTGWEIISPPKFKEIGGSVATFA